jgi:hypothetical protein
MNYDNIRSMACNGDVIGVNGANLIGRLIRSFTKEKYSHVALFVWHGTGLWVYEFTGLDGYQCTPASQWFEIHKEAEIWFGKAPAIVRANPSKVEKAASSFRASHFKRHYGFLTYINIAFAQLLKAKVTTKQKVCSTFIEHVWDDSGYRFPVTPDPGDVMKVAEKTAPLVLFTAT